MTSSFTPAELGRRIGSGLLSFPVTHFRDDLSFDEDAYREHIVRLAAYDVGGLFAAGGTGEFFSLTPAEVERVVTAAAGSAPEGTPILAPAGYGTATAVEFATAAERAGADGILLFPPYLTEASQEGLARHVEAVCRATSLGVVIYSRANAVYQAGTVARLAENCPNLIGYKDGVGDIDTVTRIHARLGDRLTYIGGLPTAETYALPYLQLGVTTYSSAIFNFLPEFALTFYRAVRELRQADVTRMLSDFVLPYTEIRNRRAGYAVSIVKAGLTATGHGAGPVRPPLTDLTPAELDELKALIAALPAA
ncbi:5-dehydro-4-deoxyglucarate dehydratase [Streptomyces griseoviridis]|jgi:5-dehydro-4-deoxyglucarate dehydratase|uniref:Probable 5-dehydro-4-deoxyglucarate dehydratase n=3 Tax=Streptomyces TaxID=1883 RepID=A0A918GIT8_STRGD|nr:MULTISPECIES: 5-dehydro-4-deoxyglucarate dehydratase [Streptomyces]MDP9679641.1 5-dehydro-4-deoxyglucarate dehydratase [Streptomyces griseoviridis]GGS39788.1 putative 5-dehydro-4-deoxyglucarate dehydratase [Streptomyces niveoruber]GGS99712.1 putative 5-dehydro-4-deoxyglucarate dehydratase [Streptomyces griseoviridis]GGU23828.1 putative 5-dehydro-4-deoxyglucarate dehydratase [Streptomyces daghestanicus]GHI29913.1 putative 5-dehydro-4-deoxyglucarate dehydratase [Streptomyces daghestanicus]